MPSFCLNLVCMLSVEMILHEVSLRGSPAISATLLQGNDADYVSLHNIDFLAVKERAPTLSCPDHHPDAKVQCASQGTTLPW